MCPSIFWSVVCVPLFGRFLVCPFRQTRISATFADVSLKPAEGTHLTHLRDTSDGMSNISEKKKSAPRSDVSFQIDKKVRLRPFR